MEDEEFFKRQLNAAINGGNSDGRLLLNNIATLLANGYDQGLNHGLLPKEYVKYLSDVLFRICESPTEANKILKVSKPPHREAHINVLYDGAITFLCMKAGNKKKADLDNLPEDIFLDVAIDISENYKEFLNKRPNTKKDTISEATVRRAYKQLYPIISKFKNIKGYKYALRFLNNETIQDRRESMTLTDLETAKNLIEEISDCQLALNVLSIVPENDDILKNELTKSAHEMIYKDDNT